MLQLPFRMMCSKIQQQLRLDPPQQMLDTTLQILTAGTPIHGLDVALEPTLVLAGEAAAKEVGDILSLLAKKLPGAAAIATAIPVAAQTQIAASCDQMT